jgi:hypothetical protein
VIVKCKFGNYNTSITTVITPTNYLDREICLKIIPVGYILYSAIGILSYAGKQALIKYMYVFAVPYTHLGLYIYLFAQM